MTLVLFFPIVACGHAAACTSTKHFGNTEFRHGFYKESRKYKTSERKGKKIFLTWIYKVHHYFLEL